MDGNFQKFKKKVWIDILIKCVIIGLAAGFFAVNAVLLPCKLFGIQLFWLYYVLIALGGIALGGGIAFLIFRTDDKSIAKRIDAELGLDERVQTAYEFSGNSGEILELQRENACASLEKFPARSLPFKNILITVICAALLIVGVAAVPVVSYTVPPVFASTNNPTDKDPPRPVSDWEWKKLDDLIEYVSKSKKFDTEAKNGTLNELQGLKRLLLAGITQNSLPIFVENTATNIANLVKDANGKYPNVSETELHPQAKSNNEEYGEVVDRLYEIFGMRKTGDDEKPGGTQGGDKEGNENGENSSGEGLLNVNDMPFFDPEEGYVKAGVALEKYYLMVQQALEEGTISSEEWEAIVVKYFADLSSKDND